MRAAAVVGLTTVLLLRCSALTSCAWSVDGASCSVAAFGSSTIIVWTVKTCQQLHLDLGAAVITCIWASNLPNQVRVPVSHRTRESPLAGLKARCYCYCCCCGGVGVWLRCTWAQQAAA